MKTIKNPLSIVGGRIARLRRNGGRPSRSALALILATIAGVAAAGFVWYQKDQGQRRADTVNVCLAASTPASQAIFSYDYRNFDAGVANARSFITGGFLDDYNKTTAGLKATAVQAQAVVQAQVSAVGVVDASATVVDVLVYLNQYRRNTNITGEKVDQNRVVLAMVRTGAGCRVSAATAI
jgi:Mce-associated membrane protein